MHSRQKLVTPPDLRKDQRAICLLANLGNGLVIYVTGFKMKKTVNSVWFLNLALADFLFTAFLVFTAVSLSQKHHWPFGQSMCKLNNFVSLVNMFASVFFLMVINLDRCLSTWVVAWAQNERTVFKAQIISAVIWFAAGICSTPSACFRIVTYQDNDTQCVYNRLQNVRKHLSHRLIVFIIVAFFICWLPFHVMSFIDLASSNKQDLKKIVKIGGPLTLSLAFMNSCLNPILYVFIRDDFQNQLHQSRTVGKAQVISALIWLAAGICSTPYAYFRTVEVSQNQTYCKYTSTMTKNKHWTLFIFRFVMGFLIPFLAIFFSYVAIGIRARRLQRMRKQRRHRIIFAIIFAFFTCWLPFHVLSFIQLKFFDYSDVQYIVRVIGPLTVSLAFTNSCLNPILYVFMCDEFQKKLKQSIWLVLENALGQNCQVEKAYLFHFYKLNNKMTTMTIK
uniref:Si:dkey-42l23.2 n=1 Tax=Xiphophorus couchianus TaxID=32473 RepID=A0A3B5KPP3_9TELE